MRERSYCLLVEVLYTALYDDAYPFESLAATIKRVIYPEHLENPNSILVIWGGEDISPSYYKQIPNKFCGAGAHPSKRDVFEADLLKKAIE